MGRNSFGQCHWLLDRESTATAPETMRMNYTLPRQRMAKEHRPFVRWWLRTDGANMLGRTLFSKSCGFI